MVKNGIIILEIEKGNFIADVYFGESNMISKYSKVLINSNS